MTGTAYTGHGAKTGGLQRHSVGDMYPFTVIAKGVPGRIKWHAMDLRTGNEGHPRPTYKEAELDVYSVRLRNLMHS